MGEFDKDFPHPVVVGDRVCLDGHEWVVLRAVTGELAQYQNPRTGELKYLRSIEFMDLYCANRVWRLPDQSGIDDKLKERLERLVNKDYALQTDTEKFDQKRRLFYLRWLALGGCRFTKIHIQEMLGEVAKRWEQEARKTTAGYTEKPPHWRRVEYWWRRKSAAGGSSMALATDNSAKGNRERKGWLKHKWIADLVKEAIHARMLTGGSSGDARAYFEKHIKEKLPGIPDAELPTVSRQTLHKLYLKIPAWYRGIKKLGPRRTRELMRGGEGEPVPEYALDVVELDHTELPFLVYCHRRRMLLGRPVLALAIDVRTGAILGFYLGFLPEGDLTTMMCIRHAVLPKTYVANLFPDIKNIWKQYGKWRVVILDRALQNFSDSTKALCAMLDTEIVWAKPYTGWMKPHVEALNRSIQRAIGTNIDWNKIRALWDGDMEEVEKYPVITFAALLHVIHKWIIDVYNEHPGGLLYQVPNDQWDESTAFCQPTLPDRKSDIDTVFGLVKSGTLNHRGIRYKHICYYSDDLRRIREECGDSVLVSFKLNPTNLGKIRVKHPERDEYYEARPIRRHRDLVDGLTEYQYDRIRAYAWNKFRQRGNFRAYLRAQEEIHEILDLYFADMNIGDRKRVARYEAVGVESAFADMSWEGEIGGFKGILAGEEETIKRIARMSTVPDPKRPANDIPPTENASPALADIPPVAPQDALAPRKRRKSTRKPANSAVAQTAEATVPKPPPANGATEEAWDDEFAPRPRGDATPALVATISRYRR